MTRRIKYILAAVCCVLTIFFVSFVWLGSRASDEAEQLRQLVDAPARMVWVRQAKSGAKDVFARGDRFQLMGLDTEDRIGIRVILHGIENYNKPMFTSRGDRIVFSNVPEDKIYAVNWDGTGLQELHSGRAAEVWMDAATGVEWVYRIPSGRAVADEADKTPLTRFQLDNPMMEEMVWDITPVNADTIQLSEDGAYLCSQFPWPEAGLLDIQNGEIIPLGKGCWTSMAPDNSYLMWIFDGPHRNLIFHSMDNRRKWSVNISQAPNVKDHEVYHPRWSNHDRFMCMTGPYDRGIIAGGGEVSVYAGRFNEQMTEIEAWVRVTDHGLADFFPDLWIQPDKGRYHAPDMARVGSAMEPEKIAGERLTVGVKLVELTLVPSLEEIAPYTQTLVVYRYEVIDVLSGHYDRPQILVAHWGILDRKRTDLQTRVGDTVELELEPYGNRNELEGERLVMEISDMQHPLFYDVKGR